jgi:serine beta-lactamase-like protein LACTB
MVKEWRYPVLPLRTRPTLLLCLALPLLAVAGYSSAQEVRAQQVPVQKPWPILTLEQSAAIDSAVQAEMEKQQAVGVAVGVIEQGKIVYLQGYGLADREAKKPVTINTVFNWASNSKPLAAVAAMQLVDQRLLDLDADVRKYVPEFPDKAKTITTRHLLAHQSGIPHYANGLVLPTLRRYDTPQPYLDPVLALDRFNRSALIFSPGEKQAYSSYAYILLSAVVQRAGQESFTRQVQDRIATPLGMASLTLDVEAKDQPHWSAGYIKSSTGAIVRAKDDANYWKHGAGGYKSNVKDFARWAQALLNHELVSADAERQMWTLQKLTNGSPGTYGLGFVVEQQNGLKISHNGSQDEVTTRMVLYPESRRGVVVMTNCKFAKPGEISTVIFKALRTE